MYLGTIRQVIFVRFHFGTVQTMLATLRPLRYFRSQFGIPRPFCQFVLRVLSYFENFEPFRRHFFGFVFMPF